MLFAAIVTASMASTNASARGASLPSISPTFQTNQMLTPHYLERITIDNPHYRGYVAHSTQTQPCHLNAMQKRVQHYGDNYFFVHKDIPVHQSYYRTALALSDVRPWDDIVSRPLQSQRVIQKELHLPFPTEHPYTSHISQFAVFPDTTTNTPFVQPTAEPHTPQSTSPGSRPNTVNACTQTPLTHDRQHTAASMSTSMVPKPATPYYVLHKASERGHRVESRFLSVPAPIETRFGSRGCHLLWDMPRSHRHQRSYTYPAPSLQFGPVTPNAALLVSPRTQEALASIHKTLTRTTTYSEHFPGHSTGVQNILRLEESTRGSHRPHTAESRGKYGSSRGRAGCTLDERATDQQYHQSHNTGILSESQNQEFEFETGNPVQKQTKSPTYTSNGKDLDATEQVSDESKAEKEEDTNPRTAGDSTGAQVGAELSPPKETARAEELKASGECNKMDKATQTDPEDFTQPIQSPTHTANIHPRSESQSRLPHISNTSHLTQTEHELLKPSTKPEAGHSHYKLPKCHSENKNKLPTTGTQFQSLPSWAHGRRPHSADSLYSYTPRTVSSTRRMMSAYDYSKSDALRRFHQQYRETTPDLREYNIREGKRHIIHGNHAYFFH